MVRIVFASLALVLAAPALAETAPAAPVSAAPAPVPVAFTHDGVDYIYTVTPISGERRVLEGTADGARFRLVVSKSRVQGTIQNRPVAFSLSEVRALTARERLATR